MAGKTTKTKAYDLARLTQAQVAWLTGKSPYWLRMNGQHFARNPDGSYDGREVFSVMAALHGRVVWQPSEFDRLVDYVADPKNCELCQGTPRADCEFHGPGECWDPATYRKKCQDEFHPEEFRSYQTAAER